MSDIFSLKGKKTFFYNSYYLYLSHFSDYFLSLFFIPFIARKIGVIEFGKIGIAQAFGVFILLFMDFGSPLMATREVSRIKDNQAKLKDFLNSVFHSKLFLLPIALLILFIMMFSIPFFFENIKYISIVFLGSVFQGFSPVWYFHGIEKMKVVSMSKMLFRTIGFLIIIIFVKSPLDSWIVLASFTLSSALICFYLNYKMIIKVGSLKLKYSKEIFSVYKKSYNSLLITIIPQIYQNLGIIVMSAFVSPLQLGYFHSSNRIYRAFNTLYSPISVSFFPIFSSIDQKNKTRLNLLKKYLILLVIMGIAFFSLTFFFADYIIIFLFGSKFSSASETLKLFSFVLPLTAFSNALGRQWLMAKNKDLYYSISLSISSIIALIFFIFFVKTIGINAFPISLIIFESLSIIIISYFLFAND